MKEIKCEFKKQSRLGKGRAFLIFRDNPRIDFTREITDLCLEKLRLRSSVRGRQERICHAISA